MENVGQKFKKFIEDIGTPASPIVINHPDTGYLAHGGMTKLETVATNIFSAIYSKEEVNRNNLEWAIDRSIHAAKYLLSQCENLHKTEENLRA
jgi:hypothetical protein